MSHPLISLIVSNLNGMNLNLLEECLNSLMKPGFRNWELIVVDNHSEDESVPYLKKKFSKLKNCFLVKNPANIYTKGLNLGAKKAAGEYLAYFHNDVILEKGYFQELVKAFQKDETLGIAQGKLLNYYDHKKIDSAGETIDKYGNPITIGSGDTDEGQYDQIEEILSASGSACMIRKDIFEKLGKYDPDFNKGYEDMDIALRARKLGYKVKKIPKAVVYHKRASTNLAYFIRVKIKWHFNKNRIVTMIKNYPSIMLYTTLPITFILYIGIGLYEWVMKKNWDFGWVRFKSLFWVAANLPKIFQKRYVISELGSKQLSKSDLALFSSKSILSIFNDFVKR